MDVNVRAILRDARLYFCKYKKTQLQRERNYRITNIQQFYLSNQEEWDRPTSLIKCYKNAWWNYREEM